MQSELRRGRLPTGGDDDHVNHHDDIDHDLHDDVDDHLNDAWADDHDIDDHLDNAGADDDDDGGAGMCDRY